MDLLFRIGNEILNIDTRELTDAVQDGKIKIFFYKDFLLKALPVEYEKDSLFSRIKDLKRICENLSQDIKNFVSFYGLPFAKTIDFKNYLKVGFSDKSLVLLYRKPSLNDLNSYLENENPLSEKRRTVYKNLIRILIELDKLGVKLLDLYPDNFLVDHEGNVYLADLVKAGIIDENDQWIYEPLHVSKEHIFPLPPEIALSNQVVYNSNIWLGVYLIFFVLTGKKPFDFLSGKRSFDPMKIYDHEYLQSILLKIYFSQDLWPPVFSLSALSKINTNKYNSFSKEYNSIFKKGLFSKILMNTYIRGYKNYRLRPNFEQIDQAVVSELEMERFFRIDETKKHNVVEKERKIQENLVPIEEKFSNKEELFSSEENVSFDNSSLQFEKSLQLEKSFESLSPYEQNDESTEKKYEERKIQENLAPIEEKSSNKEELFSSEENVSFDNSSLQFEKSLKSLSSNKQNDKSAEKEYSTEKKYNEDVDRSKLLVLPFSVRQYVKKIISGLKEKKIYTSEMRESIEISLNSGEIYFLVNIFVKTRDVEFIALILKFIYSGYWHNFNSNLKNLSEVSGINIYKIISTKIIPLVNKYKKMNINLIEHDKEIFRDLNDWIFKEITSYKKNIFLRYFNIFLIFVILFSLITPWVLFYVFNLNYVMIALFYPVVLIFLGLVFKIFSIISRVR